MVAFNIIYYGFLFAFRNNYGRGKYNDDDDDDDLYLYLYPLGWHTLPSHANAEACLTGLRNA